MLEIAIQLLSGPMANWITLFFIIVIGIPGILWWMDKFDKKDRLGRYENKLSEKTVGDLIDLNNKWSRKRRD